MRTKKLEPVGTRFAEVLQELGLLKKEAALLLEVSESLVGKWEKTQSSIPEKQQWKICEVFFLNENWFMHGATGEMFAIDYDTAKDKVKAQLRKIYTSKAEADTSNPYRDALVIQLREENARAINELNRVWAMVNHLTGGKIPNFHNATIEAGLLAKYLPGVGFNKPLVA